MFFHFILINHEICLLWQLSPPSFSPHHFLSFYFLFAQEKNLTKREMYVTKETRGGQKGGRENKQTELENQKVQPNSQRTLGVCLHSKAKQ